jgi:hypothetical protein
LAWFVYAQTRLVYHDEPASTEALMSAPHFTVLISLVSLHHDLAEACQSGVCNRGRATYAWLAPPLVSVFFDILTLQRVYLFYAEDETYLRVLAIFAVASSAVSAVWCFAVVRGLGKTG